MDNVEPGRSATWKWTICGLLFLATLLNYMDRQTLSITSQQIDNELQFGDANYGRLELAFGYAFALGGLLFGMLADKINVWLLYPIVLLGWSLAGFLTGYVEDVGQWVAPLYPEAFLKHWDLYSIPTETRSTYLGLLTCRTVLGVFEAGQWPCALITTQRLLSQRDRPLGNSLLQSGASIGAILTPVASYLLVSEKRPGSWAVLFTSIGAIGMLWVIPWFAMIRPRDLARPAAMPEKANAPKGQMTINFVRMYLAAAVVVLMINVNWHFYRAWLPKFMYRQGYTEDAVKGFNVVYYLLTDVGCIVIGAFIGMLVRRGWTGSKARLLGFAICTLLCLIASTAGFLKASPLLLSLLTLNALGSLALFPIYYSLTQELSARHQGKVTGTLSFLGWMCTGTMQGFVGQAIKETGSYSQSMIMAGVAPVIALVLLAILWPREEPGQAPVMTSFH